MRGSVQTGLLCAAIFMLAGYAGAAPKLAAGHTTVLPPSEGRHLPYQPRGAVYGTPSTSDLKNLEADLPKRLFPYYRQYLGLTQQGRRLIYINGFSAREAPEMTGGPYDWHRHLVVVFDGGDDFFQATYDPALRRLTSLSFNGPYLVPSTKHRAAKHR